MYDARSGQLRRTFARFKDKAYSGTFRADGKVLAAGGEDGLVQAHHFFKENYHRSIMNFLFCVPTTERYSDPSFIEI